MRRTIVWMVLTVIMAAESRGQSVQRVLLPVKVNETARGEIFVYIDGDDILIPETFLRDLKIPLDAAAVQTRDDERFVSLRSLAPRISFTFDPNDVALAITVDPTLLPRSVLELRSASLIADRGGDPSIFFNYALAGQRSSTPGVFTEVGASKGHRFAYTGLSRTSTGNVIRGLSYLSFESPRDLRRITIGDALVGTDSLGGTVAIGGVTLARQFSLQPYFIRTPSLDLTGAAVTPSVVEVYINGQMTNRVSVDPGVFTLRNLPATGGLGETRVVIRDAFGRETVQERSFYYSTLALRRGLSDYVFSIGKVRNDLQRSFDYDEAAGYAQYRKGITDSLTLGGRAEASQHVVSGGPSVTIGSRIGDFDLQLAASSADGTTGTAGSFTYRFSGPRFSFGVAAVDRSERYATLSLTPAFDRPLRDLSLFAAANFHAVSLGVTASRNDLRDGDEFDRLAVQANVTLGRWATLFSSVGTTRRNGKKEPELLLGLTFGLARHTTGNAQFQRSEGKEQTLFQVRRPLGASNGYGYSLQTDTLTEQQFANLQYQTSYGRYEIAADSKRPSNASYNIAGGLVFIGGTIRPTRPVQEGFALARLGVSGVQVFASNQAIGRTDRSGDLLISNLLPHYQNEVRISDKDIPIEYEVSGTQVLVVPPTRGGVIATFPVRRLHSYTGRISFNIIGQPFAPALGEIEVERKDGPMVFGLGRNGEFYVEQLDPGTYKARLRTGKVHCDFPLVLPKSDAALTDLGVISCAP